MLTSLVDKDFDTYYKVSCLNYIFITYTCNK